MLLKVQPKPKVSTLVSVCLSDLQSVHLYYHLAIPLSECYLVGCYTEMSAGFAAMSD